MDLLIFLAVILGSGKLNWVDEDEEKPRLTPLKRGDVYRLKPGSVFYLRSNLEAEREKLRIYAIFVNSEDGDLNVGIFFSITLLFFLGPLFSWILSE